MKLCVISLDLTDLHRVRVQGNNVDPLKFKEIFVATYHCCLIGTLIDSNGCRIFS